jgi:hypothetical protein
MTRNVEEAVQRSINDCISLRKSRNTAIPICPFNAASRGSQKEERKNLVKRKKLPKLPGLTKAIRGKTLGHSFLGSCGIRKAKERENGDTRTQRTF